MQFLQWYALNTVDKVMKAVLWFSYTQMWTVIWIGVKFSIDVNKCDHSRSYWIAFREMPINERSFFKHKWVLAIRLAIKILNRLFFSNCLWWYYTHRQFVILSKDDTKNARVTLSFLPNSFYLNGLYIMTQKIPMR